MKKSRNKKLLLYFVIFLMLIPFPLVHAEEATVEAANILKNGGFESTGGESLWGGWVEPGAEASFTIVDYPVHEGDQAMKLIASGLPQWKTAIIKQTIGMQPNEWFS